MSLYSLKIVTFQWLCREPSGGWNFNPSIQYAGLI